MAGANKGRPLVPMLRRVCSLCVINHTSNPACTRGLLATQLELYSHVLSVSMFHHTHSRCSRTSFVYTGKRTVHKSSLLGPTLSTRAADLREKIGLCKEFSWSEQSTRLSHTTSSLASFSAASDHQQSGDVCSRQRLPQPQLSSQRSSLLLPQTAPRSAQDQNRSLSHHSALSSNPHQTVSLFSTLTLRNCGHLPSKPRDLNLQATSQSHQFGCPRYSTASRIVEACPLSIQPYLRLIRMDKPIGTWLLYWPCTWSIALASQPGTFPDVYLLALFGAGAFFMRGAGCIINDMWDKDFDEKVERTKSRPLASGDLTHFQALVFLGSQLSCALAILLQLNLYSIILGVASMGLVITYPLAKRYTYWPQFILGLTFNYGVLLGYSAVSGCVDWSVCLPMYVASVLWTLVYDTVYAHQDKYDDLLIGVKSAAIRLGEQTKPVLTAFTAAMAAGLVTSGYMADMTWPYYVAVALTTGRLAQQVYSTNLDVADQCAHAFRGNFYLGAIMFVGILLSNWLKPRPQDPEPGEQTTQEMVPDEASHSQKDTVYFMPR